VSAPAELPYRPNVGAVVFNPAGLVFIGRRANIGDPAGPAWQLPQGGIDDGEDPATAVRRELAEETGIERVTLLAEHDAWLTYDLPAELVGRAFGGRYRGQRQRWFALRFEGADSDIRLDAHGAVQAARLRGDRRGVRALRGAGVTGRYRAATKCRRAAGGLKPRLKHGVGRASFHARRTLCLVPSCWSS
jgi:putative (di)nucleoside polyphosphate hydrolase